MVSLLLPFTLLTPMSLHMASRCNKCSAVQTNALVINFQVVMATSSPDDMFGDACVVANAVGAKGAVAFDLTAACSGFLFGLVTASQFLHSSTYK